MTRSRQSGLTICVPAYNEEKALARTVETVLAAAESALAGDFEILIVNDGSTDETRSVADRLAGRDKRVRALHQPQNRGVGAAFKRALSEASFDRITLIPGDYAYQQEGIELLMHNARSADILVSYRANKYGRPSLRQFLSIIFSGWLRVIVNLPIRDGHSLYVFPVKGSRVVVPRMPDDYRYHAVTLVHLLRNARSFVQVPVPLMPRADQSSGVMRLSFLLKITGTMIALFVESLLNRPLIRRRAREITPEHMETVDTLKSGGLRQEERRRD